MEEQVFISYRRMCEAWVAELYKDFLTSNGWQVFLDKDSIGSGLWKERIENALSKITDFIVILAPKSLDRCIENPQDPDDYFRYEIEYAITHNKNIIPVMWDGYNKPEAFGSNLPKMICRIFDYNGISDAGNSARMRENINTVVKMLQTKPKRDKNDFVLENKYPFDSKNISYNSMEPRERKRVHLQACYSEQLDKQSFSYAKK